MFPWPEAVVPIQTDGSDVLQVISDLSAEPARIATISQRNAAEALLRHDWAYRWNQMFRIIGLPISAGMAAREERLKEIARPLMQRACMATAYK